MTLQHRNLAFIGKAGAGKSTCTEILLNRYPGVFTKVSFADSVRHVSCHVWGPEDGERRDKLVAVGMAVRAIDEDAWLNKALERIGFECNAAKRFVIDDVRFPNEYHRLREEGFVLVRVMADRNTRLARLQAKGKIQDETQLEDPTETGLDDLAAFPSDYVVSNSDTSRQDLAEQLARIVRRETF